MCVFGRPIWDFIPIPPGKYRPHETWRETLKAREEALRKRHIRTADVWAEHTKRLPPLVVGDFVRIQNQTGPHPNKWDRTGSVVEVRQDDQYVVKVDGSGRITLRNRKFLRKFHPFRNDLLPPRTIYDDLATSVATPASSAAPCSPSLVSVPVTPVMKTGPTPPPVPASPDSPLRGPQPDPVTTVAPDQGTPGRPTPHMPRPGPGASVTSPPGPAASSPVTGLRRSIRATSVPAWHKDYSMD